MRARGNSSFDLIIPDYVDLGRIRVDLERIKLSLENSNLKN